MLIKSLQLLPHYLLLILCVTKDCFAIGNTIPYKCVEEPRVILGPCEILVFLLAAGERGDTTWV